MIRPAVESDLDRIAAILDESKAIMQAQGNFQWDERYPLREDFRRDILSGDLFVCHKEDAIAGFICINCDMPPAYADASWQNSGHFLVIHRMAVAPAFRGSGFAGALLDFAIAFAAQNGAEALRTDTFSGNASMNALFKKSGYRFAGEIVLPGKKQQPFYCYEKIIT